MPPLPMYLDQEADIWFRVWRWPGGITSRIGRRIPAVSRLLQRDRIARREEARLAGDFTGDGFFCQRIEMHEVPHLVSVFFRATSGN